MSCFRKGELNAIRARLRASGLSPSAPRVAIYRWLVAHPVHPTVDVIYKALRSRLPTLSRTTVYNVLHAFVEHGLAIALHVEDLEVRYDGNVMPHAHFKCLRCGRLMDLGMLPTCLGEMVNLPEMCAVRSAALTFSGFCSQCVEVNGK